MTSEQQEQQQQEQQHVVTDPALLEPQRYINTIPGKNVRGKLIDCFQIWLKVESDDVLTKIKDVIADLHNASLLIDDIEDNSQLRRGVPVAHNIFGVASVINCANYVYFLALERCHSLGNEDAMKIFVKEMLNLHRGQGFDIMWRDSMKCPTEEQYIQMVKDKTGGLFRLAVGLLQSFSTPSSSSHQSTDFTPLVNNLGLYFQIRDDLINLADEEYHKSKSFCEDLTEGKFSFPIIHAIRSDESDTRLLSILKQRTTDVDVKKYAQGLMREKGSLVYTRDKCKMLKVEIVEQVKGLGGNKALLKLIELLDVQVDRLEDAVSVPPVSLSDSESSSGKMVDGDGKKKRLDSA